MSQSYRIYVTDSLMLSAEGKYISKRWWSMVDTNREEIDAEHVISDIVNRAGLEVIRNESARSGGEDHM